MKSGYYCPECGTVQVLGSGQIVCSACGSLGLRGFQNEHPRRVQCPVDGCAEDVWDDGGVNPGELQHRWSRHSESFVAAPPEADK